MCLIENFDDIREKRHNEFGVYTPAFFMITLKNGAELIAQQNNNPLVSKITAAAFLHEYVHLLQDLTTPFGLSRICCYLDYIKWINSLYRTTDILIPPCIPNDSSLYNVQNDIFMKNFAGSGHANEFLSINNVSLQNSSIENIKVCVIDYKTNFSLSNKYTVGEYAISESMAYNIENYIFPGVLPSPPIFPYNTVDILVKHYCPELSDSPLHIITLCDACLMYENPGISLFYVLEKIKGIKRNKLTPNDLYDFVNSLSCEIYNQKIKTIDVLGERHEQAKQSWEDLFTANNFPKVKNHIQKMMETAFMQRKNNPYFILDAVKESKKENLSKFTLLLEEIGAPLILNGNKDEIVQITPTNNIIDTSYLWVINQIYKIFREGVKLGTYKCEMFNFCKKNLEDQKLTNELKKLHSDLNCIYCPWKRSETSEERSFCSFGRYWYSCNMKDIG
jgi:hypothetical protein